MSKMSQASMWTFRTQHNFLLSSLIMASSRSTSVEAVSHKPFLVASFQHLSCFLIFACRFCSLILLTDGVDHVLLCVSSSVLLPPVFIVLSVSSSVSLSAICLRPTSFSSSAALSAVYLPLTSISFSATSPSVSSLSGSIFSICPTSMGTVLPKVSPHSICCFLLLRASNLSLAPFCIALTTRSKSVLIAGWVPFDLGGSATFIIKDINHFYDIIGPRSHWSCPAMQYLHLHA